MLASRLAMAGHDVTCFKGVGATWPGRVEGGHVIPFATNQNLMSELEGMENRKEVRAIFHTAALCDYTVKSVQALDGRELAAAKIPSCSGELTLTLTPTSKLIHELRTLFPLSRIIGWKYELNGSKAESLVAAQRQVADNQSDACVINGAAYGSGFGFYEPGTALTHCPDKNTLCDFLVKWLRDAA